MLGTGVARLALSCPTTNLALLRCPRSCPGAIGRAQLDCRLPRPHRAFFLLERSALQQIALRRITSFEHASARREATGRPALCIDRAAVKRFDLLGIADHRFQCYLQLLANARLRKRWFVIRTFRYAIAQAAALKSFRQQHVPLRLQRTFGKGCLAGPADINNAIFEEALVVNSSTLTHIYGALP